MQAMSQYLYHYPHFMSYEPWRHQVARLTNKVQCRDLNTGHSEVGFPSDLYDAQITLFA